MSAEKPRWSLPAALAVQVLALGCPSDDEQDTGNDAATVASASESSDPSSDTDASVDCAALAGEECNAHPSCAERPEFGGCVLDCEALDQADCDAVPHCDWDGDICDWAPVA